MKKYILNKGMNPPYSGKEITADKFDFMSTGYIRFMTDSNDIVFIVKADLVSSIDVEDISDSTHGEVY